MTALTGKGGEHGYLRSLGAKDVLSRNGLQKGTRPLEKSLWAGAVDAVGGDTLAWLTRTMQYNGCIASSGLTGGTDLHTTVLPFILRGVKLLGIDSAMCPMPKRQDVWRRIATDMKPGGLHAIAKEIGLDQLPDAPPREPKLPSGLGHRVGPCSELVRWPRSTFGPDPAHDSLSLLLSRCFPVSEHFREEASFRFASTARAEGPAPSGPFGPCVQAGGEPN